jgi:hypothetical protein
LHFSTHQYFESTPDGTDGSPPPDDALAGAIDDEREMLERVTDEPVDVVSFHNPPEWTFRRSFDGCVSTYEERFLDDVAYVADSNQRWREANPFSGSLASRLQILAHPVLWGEREGFATDRQREERDFCFDRIEEHLEVTDRTWRSMQSTRTERERANQ